MHFLVEFYQVRHLGVTVTGNIKNQGILQLVYQSTKWLQHISD